MKTTHRINLGEDKDIIVEVPDGVELSTEHAFLLAGIVGQEQVAAGNVRVIERVWPCFYCGRKFLAQMRLVQHLKTHDELIKNAKEKLGAWKPQESDKVRPHSGLKDAPVDSAVSMPDLELSE